MRVQPQKTKKKQSITTRARDSRTVTRIHSTSSTTNSKTRAADPPNPSPVSALPLLPGAFHQAVTCDSQEEREEPRPSQPKTDHGSESSKSSGKRNADANRLELMLEGAAESGNCRPV
ncbi:hypothetical protein SAY87_011906 [Trapa incisa]|uniref:Uncharacterized protein n=1 Tax=Trapa incisa TaxID=236973 RepID=A0AAN7GPI7_9MYRT|nr:hypothetical protein SAY87_011906 [Trapa incisa]